jgi:hypothetical protein
MFSIRGFRSEMKQISVNSNLTCYEANSFFYSFGVEKFIAMVQSRAAVRPKKNKNLQAQRDIA